MNASRAAESDNGQARTSSGPASVGPDPASSLVERRGATSFETFGRSGRLKTEEQLFTAIRLTVPGRGRAHERGTSPRPDKASRAASKAVGSDRFARRWCQGAGRQARLRPPLSEARCIPPLGSLSPGGQDTRMRSSLFMYIAAPALSSEITAWCGSVVEALLC